MKNILIRASQLPFEKTDVDEAVFKDTIWGNSGNLLFVFGLLRNIYRKDWNFEKYVNVNENDADWINENFDMFLMPFANAFRDNWIGELEKWTKLIKRLTIPCVIVGVGLQAKYEPDFSGGGVQI